MRTLLFVALILSATTANAHFWNSKAAKLAGTWTFDHVVMVLDFEEEGEADWVETPVTNKMVIKKVSRRKIQFELDSWYTNAHSCYMEGVAVKKGKKFIYEGEEDFDGKTCKLEISKNEQGELELKDENNACKWNNCGMRGYIDGLTFDQKN